MTKGILAILLAMSSLTLNLYAGDKAKGKGPEDSKNRVTVKLSTRGNDIAFDQVAIQIPFADKIYLNFNNEATKGSEILHNVAILKPGSLDGFLKDLQNSGYDMEKIKNHPSILAMTAALVPGAAQTVEFSPKEPGFYPFVCIMPGHADMLGMKGMLNIAKSISK